MNLVVCNSTVQYSTHVLMFTQTYSKSTWFSLTLIGRAGVSLPMKHQVQTSLLMIISKWVEFISQAGVANVVSQDYFIQVNQMVLKIRYQICIIKYRLDDQKIKLIF